MNTGNVKRNITIDQIEDDIFSDDIQTTALIEEIEAAEFAARQANIEQQINASQPTFLENLSKKASSAANGATRTLRKSKKSLKNAAGKLFVDFSGVSAAGQKKINALAPEGVTKTRVAEYCVAAALITAAGTIWGWNLTHPLFSNVEKTNETVEIVPITGTPAAETSDDSPVNAAEAETEATPDNSNSAANVSGASTNTPRTRAASNTSSANASGSSQSSSSSSSNKSTANNSANTNKTANRITTDDNWDASKDIQPESEPAEDNNGSSDDASGAGEEE